MSNTPNNTLVVNFNTGEGLSPEILALNAPARMTEWLAHLHEKYLSKQFLLKRPLELDLTLEGTQHNLSSLCQAVFLGIQLTRLTITETQEKSIAHARQITIDALLESDLLNQGYLKHLSLQQIGYPYLGRSSKEIETQRELIMRGWFPSEDDEILFEGDEPRENLGLTLDALKLASPQLFNFPHMEVGPLYTKLLEQDMLACKLESLAVTIRSTESSYLPLYLIPKTFLPSLKHLSICFEGTEAISPYPFFTSLALGEPYSDETVERPFKVMALSNSVCSQLESLALNGLYLPAFVHGSVYTGHKKTPTPVTLSADTSPLEEDRKVIGKLERGPSDTTHILVGRPKSCVPTTEGRKVASLRGTLTPSVSEATWLSRTSEDATEVRAEGGKPRLDLLERDLPSPGEEDWYFDAPGENLPEVDPVDLQKNLHDNYPHPDYRAVYADLAAVPRTGAETLRLILRDIKAPALKSLRQLSLTGWKGATMTPDVVGSLLTSLTLNTLVLTEDPRFKKHEKEEIRSNFPAVKVLWES